MWAVKEFAVTKVEAHFCRIFDNHVYIDEVFHPCANARNNSATKILLRANRSGCYNHRYLRVQ